MDSISIMMLVVLVAVFYFMIIRPENKRKKAAEQLRNSLKKGDKLTTIGGIVGSIVQVNDDTIVIETSDDRVRMEITKWAVSTTGVQTSTDPKAQKNQKAVSDDVPEEPALPDDEPSETAEASQHTDTSKDPWEK